MTMRTQLKAGRAGSGDNHNETLKVRTALKAGGQNLNHNEVLQVRTALKAGGVNLNHSETLQVRSTLRAGGKDLNHNEALKVRTEREQPAISMRKHIRRMGSAQDRLEFLVVRAGLRAGRVARERSRGRW